MRRSQPWEESLDKTNAAISELSKTWCGIQELMLLFGLDVT
jgi:hypothetical protein